jgi:hypothetical protein
MELSPVSRARVTAAGQFFLDNKLLRRGGQIVCAGYKTPRDLAGEPWTDPETEATYQGVPEAILGKAALLEMGIPRERIAVEPNSTDTPLNLIYGRKHLNIGWITGIVSHPAHLRRVMRHIAPRTLCAAETPYIGLAVAGHDPSSAYDWIASVHSRAILCGLHADYRNMDKIASRRSRQTWKGVLLAEKFLRGLGLSFD